MAMLTITLHAHAVGEQLPDADTDVLIFDTSSTTCQLGAVLEQDCDGPVWVDAQGQRVHGVTYWAAMPELAAGAA